MVMSTTNMESEKRKEACAVETMRFMLQDYATDNSIPFLDALTLFVDSTTYQILFDFETEVWKEGPDYLRQLFERNI